MGRPYKIVLNKHRAWAPLMVESHILNQVVVLFPREVEGSTLVWDLDERSEEGVEGMMVSEDEFTRAGE